MRDWAHGARAMAHQLPWPLPFGENRGQARKQHSLPHANTKARPVLVRNRGVGGQAETSQFAQKKMEGSPDKPEHTIAY